MPACLPHITCHHMFIHIYPTRVSVELKLNNKNKIKYNGWIKMLLTKYVYE